MFFRLLIVMIILGNSSFAQPIEDRLPGCILEADEKIRIGTTIKTSFESAGQKLYSSDIVAMIYNDEMLQVLSNTIQKAIKADIKIQGLEELAAQEMATLDQKMQLTGRMLREYWNEEGMSERSKFIASCIKAFDDPAISQAERIVELELEIEGNKTRLKENNALHFARNTQLCDLMRSYDKRQVDGKKVIINKKVYPLCLSLD